MARWNLGRIGHDQIKRSGYFGRSQHLLTMGRCYRAMTWHDGLRLADLGTHRA